MIWWYVNRAAGLVAWALLSTSIVFGLLLSSKALGKKVRPNWIQDLHRGLSGLAVVFVGVHVGGAIADDYIHFGAADVLVPFASGWRPIAIAWGVVSAYLLIAVEATSLLRKHIPKAAWRKVHVLSFPLFVTATVHGITAGTELGTTLGIAVASLVTAGIAGLTAYRVIEARERAQEPKAPRITPTTSHLGAVLPPVPPPAHPGIDLAPPSWAPSADRPTEPERAPVRSGRPF
jgi:hypothetical protein